MSAWSAGVESNHRIKALQASTLPLGYRRKTLERVVGNAPTSTVWKTVALLLDDTRMAETDRVERSTPVLETDRAPFASSSLKLAVPTEFESVISAVTVQRGQPLLYGTLAPSHGFGPRFPRSERSVLPLDEEGTTFNCQRTGCRRANRTPILGSKAQGPTVRRSGITSAPATADRSHTPRTNSPHRSRVLHDRHAHHALARCASPCSSDTDPPS